MDKVNIFWFRRDLRLNDNAGLYHALRSNHPVVPVFIFDKNILNELQDRADKRVSFIYQYIEQLQTQLNALGSTLHVIHATPEEAYQQLMSTYDIATVYTNHDYEPYAIKRDTLIADMLTEKGISFYTYKDHVIFEKDEITKDDGQPYTVYTPYSKKWKAQLNTFYKKSFPTEKYDYNYYRQDIRLILPLEKMGFSWNEPEVVTPELDEYIARDYHLTRDIPSVHGTTRLSIHLRFGTISIRQLVRESIALNEKLLNELIWRDFYQMILSHFPQVVNNSFKKEYDLIEWRNDKTEFDKWRKGETGYPIVDAGMRELNATGYMHNRVRMVVASFLTKHLLIDWRWGEAYFAEKLLDYDLASNNGGWQWAAGCGCDAAPYFRIFNPYLQTKKFDPELKYIRKWVPEFEDFSYPQPIVDHEHARKRCLEVYKAALKDKMKEMH
ncbi:MAG: deoxyribodipyrimidine photo-lyase [Chitinophagaceae bacterium]|nr:deoxyribodipyrimidine photo-lyase [Chitinophagaceae bacterium]